MSFPGAGADASIRTLQHVPLDSGGFGFFVSKRACIYLVAGKIEGSYGKAARLTHRNPHPASAGWGSSSRCSMVFCIRGTRRVFPPFPVRQNICRSRPTHPQRKGPYGTVLFLSLISHFPFVRESGQPVRVLPRYGVQEADVCL